MSLKDLLKHLKLCIELKYWNSLNPFLLKEIKFDEFFLKNSCDSDI